MAGDKRKNPLLAQKVDTGLIFLAMLGTEDACAYWRASGVPEQVIERLTYGAPARR